MTHLIDKDALVAEIERLRKNAWESFQKGNSTENQYYLRNGVIMDILSFIDTLEVKDVDLEKHLKEDIEDVLFDLNGVAVKGATYYLTVEDVKDIAKHFFELGLKAQKGE